MIATLVGWVKERNPTIITMGISYSPDLLVEEMKKILEQN